MEDLVRVGVADSGHDIRGAKRRLHPTILEAQGVGESLRRQIGAQGLDPAVRIRVGGAGSEHAQPHPTLGAGLRQLDEAIAFDFQDEERTLAVRSKVAGLAQAQATGSHEVHRERERTVEVEQELLAPPPRGHDPGPDDRRERWVHRPQNEGVEGRRPHHASAGEGLFQAVSCDLELG